MPIGFLIGPDEIVDCATTPISVNLLAGRYWLMLEIVKFPFDRYPAYALMRSCSKTPLTIFTLLHLQLSCWSCSMACQAFLHMLKLV